MMTSGGDERRERALATLSKVFPPGSSGAPRLQSPKEIDRDWRRFTTFTVFGDVWSRPGLELRNRSMITVAALTVLDRPSELRLHLRGALNVGVSRQELSEIILQMALYGGFPAAMEAMRIATEVFEEVDRERESIG
jgi:4-carboxymuconolactone decarboxylase